MKSDARGRVAVIIPVYRASFLIYALISVMAQERAPDEVIVVDDGSPDQDQIDRALERWPGRITLVRQANAGAGAARNAGVRRARSPWVAFLDADDQWLPDFVGSQMAYLARHRGVDLVWADAVIDGDTPGAGRTFMSMCPSIGPVTMESLLGQTCNVITSTVVVRRGAVLDAGGFDETLRRGQDFDLWLRLAAAGACANFRHEVLAVRRVHDRNLSGTRSQELERALVVFRKALQTLPLTIEARKIACRRVRALEGDLAWELGKEALIAGTHSDARRYFGCAHRQAPGWKRFAARCGAHLAPNLLARLYRGSVPALRVDASSAV